VACSLPLLHPSLVPGHDAVVVPLLLVVLPQCCRLGHLKDMVLDLIQLAPPVHKVGADRAPVRAVEESEDTQSITLGDRRDVAVEMVLRQVCVNLGVRVGVGVKLTCRKGNCKHKLSRRRR
jgi:hypothetical protein